MYSAQNLKSSIKLQKKGLQTIAKQNSKAKTKA